MSERQASDLPVIVTEEMIDAGCVVYLEQCPDTAGGILDRWMIRDIITAAMSCAVSTHVDRVPVGELYQHDT